MHELGITRNIVAICTEQAAAHGTHIRVKRVTMEVGKLSAVMPDALRFCFDVCAKNTVLDGATLEIIEISGEGRCRSCGAVAVLDRLVGQCRCGHTGFEIIAGENLKIKEMEVV